MKFLLSIACGEGQASHIEAAVSLGYKVIGIDRNFCNTRVYQHIQKSTYSTEACVDLIDKHYRRGIEGVICRASGPAITTANEVAKTLQLPRCGDLVARMSVSKLMLSQACDDLNIRGVKTAAVECDRQLTDLTERKIVKPDIGVDGKTDIYILDGNIEDPMVLVEKARKRSINGVAVVSPFIEGRDIGLATLSLNGVCIWHCFYEESVEWLKGTIIGSSMAVRELGLAKLLETEVVETAQKIIRFSCSTGFTYFSFRVDEKKSYLYEVNAGLAGDDLAESVFRDSFPGLNFLTIDVLAMCNRFEDVRKIINGESNV